MCKDSSSGEHRKYHQDIKPETFHQYCCNLICAYCFELLPNSLSFQFYSRKPSFNTTFLFLPDSPAALETYSFFLKS